jgi:hypothetical protein
LLCRGRSLVVALSAARVLAGCRHEYLATLGRAHKDL